MKNLKLCAIHATGTHVIIFRDHNLPESDYGSLVPMAKLERSLITIKSLGQAVLGALDAPGILKERFDFDKALFEFAGFKSWGKFANATESHCVLVALGEKIKITPSFRDGRGFSGDGGKTVFCEPVVDSLGKTLFNVLELKSNN